MTVDKPVELPFGEGFNKVFGMENFGNTCYCNSILQCLFYTSKLRTELLKYNYTPHERKETTIGAAQHGFTVKYELLKGKRIRAQPKQSLADSSLVNGSGGTSTPKSIRGSIFGKFSMLGSQSGSDGAVLGKYLAYIDDAVAVQGLTMEQKLIIKRNPGLHSLKIMVSRPNDVVEAENKTDNSVSSTALLDSSSSNQKTLAASEIGPITAQSMFIVLGIPYPEPNVHPPINPFSPHPTAEQRKRSALINGPILNLDHALQDEEPGSESSLLYALKDLFEVMVEHKSQIGVVSPAHFVRKLKEKNYLFRQVNMHQDAHEFCNYLINEIIESVVHEKGEKDNWCTNIFQGIITNETKCLSCETITSKDETFLDLSIDIPPGQSAYSLTYSLNNFSKLETLNHQNKFYCNTCLSLQEAVKTIKLKKTPEILVINFKRFKYDDKLDRMVKLFDSVLYPMKLRLFNTTTKDKQGDNYKHSDDMNQQDFSLYGLYALVVHIGGGPMHGHYVALCKCKAGLWFLFDDEAVELVDDNYVLRFFGNGPGLSSAYILFYEKLDTALDDGSGLDFGIDLSGIYNGNDYFHEFTQRSPSDNSSKAATNTLDEEVTSDSESVTNPEPYVPSSSDSAGVARKGSLFKKSFMFDSKDPVGEPVTKSVSRTSSNKDISPDQQIPGKAMNIFEKKTWVNGLKRKELRAELPVLDRKLSQGSIKTLASAKSETDVKEKRRGSIFGFKRKNKS